MTIPTTTTAATVEDPLAQTVAHHQKGVAPVKKEYLVNQEALPAAEDPASTPSQPQENAAEEGGKREKTGGQNHKRSTKNKNKTRRDEPNKLCLKIAMGDECKFGDKCTYSHDVESYLAHREPDLGDRCINYEQYGKCKYGMRCRYSGAHTTKDHKQMVDEEKVMATSGDNGCVMNEFGRDMQINLRKKNVQFPRSDEFAKILQREAQEEAKEKEADDKVKKPDEEEALEGGRQEKRQRTSRGNIDYRGKTYLAPLTTVGNLPFRRVCKGFGVDITCSEMAIASNILQGQQTEWALLKRHKCEDVFGVQLAGNRPEAIGRAAELISRECEVDFIDLNMGCPIDMAYNNGGGSALLNQPRKIGKIVRTMRYVTDCDVTVKFRTGVLKNDNIAHTLVPQFEEWDAALGTLHGRSRQQRYTKLADWEYIAQCKKQTSKMPLFGGGDVLSWEEYWEHMEKRQCDGIMIGRGALIKPWIFKEIEEKKVWDISSRERLDILKDFAKFGMEHWGTDTLGINNVRRYLLEWQSFLHRYIPAGLLEVLPQRMNERPPAFVGRDDLETLMASEKAKDWIKITEMILGPAPDDFTFVPKHKSNSYEG
ncbi:FMN-linked oxidoreductase [Martensiomyces pterosporus]|nr:FMN-linked oxidoreductase [Martensiomyces pterosporus]